MLVDIWTFSMFFLQPPTLLMNSVWKHLVSKHIYLNRYLSICKFVVMCLEFLYLKVYLFVHNLCCWSFRKWFMLTGIWMLQMVVLEQITRLNILGWGLSSRWFYLTWCDLQLPCRISDSIFILYLFLSVEDYILFPRYVL